MTTTVLTADDAARRLRTDHDILLDRVAGRTEDQLNEPYRLASGPLGDFCESLHDLVAHVLMWDEIGQAMLHEALAGRTHWSVDPRWETPEMGRALNRAGVLAGRELPGLLLVDRLASVGDTLVSQFEDLAADTWSGTAGDGLGAFLERAMTVPGSPPYWHAALHLHQVPAQ